MKLIRKTPIIDVTINDIYAIWEISSEWIIPAKDKQDLRGFIKTDWQVIIQPQFEELMKSVDGIFLVKDKNFKSNAISWDWKIIFPSWKYDDIRNLDRNYFIIERKVEETNNDRKVGIIDRESNEIISPSDKLTRSMVTEQFEKMIEDWLITSEFYKNKQLRDINFKWWKLYTESKEFYIHLFEWKVYDSSENEIFELPKIIKTKLFKAVGESRARWNTLNPKLHNLLGYKLTEYNWLFIISVKDAWFWTKEYFLWKDWKLLWSPENTLGNTLITKNEWYKRIDISNWKIILNSEDDINITVYDINKNFLEMNKIEDWIYEIDWKIYMNKQYTYDDWSYVEDFMKNATEIKNMDKVIEIWWKKFKKNLLKLK